MDKIRNNNNLYHLLILFLSGFLLIFPLLLFSVTGSSPAELSKHELFFIPIVIFLVIFCLALILKQGIALNLLFLFIFAGTLFSVDIGFTLKASQVFALFAIVSILIQFFNSVPGNRGPLPGEIYFKSNYNKPDLRTFYPFLLFFLAILPSLIMPRLFSDLYEGASSLRQLLNYLFLQIVCIAIYMGTTETNKLKKGLLLCFISYLLVLAFGFFQQVGYYLNFYDPFQYVGSHSVFVDLYGPFLRISPGTFANEFGEILQSAAITLTTFLVFMKKELAFKTKVFLKFSLLITIIALILNFTRASWFIYLFYLFCLFFISRPKLRTQAFILTITLLIGTVIYYINDKTEFLNFIPILERFNELTDLSGNSAGVRLVTWEESFKLFQQSPLIGNGWGTTVETHNVPLELLSETGLIGFLGFYFLMGILLLRFFKMLKSTSEPFLKTVAASLLFTLAGCLIFDFTNHGIYHFILWLIIGLGLATEKIINKENLNQH
jgi:O-antigen ligase